LAHARKGGQKKKRNKYITIGEVHIGKTDEKVKSNEEGKLGTKITIGTSDKVEDPNGGQNPNTGVGQGTRLKNMKQGEWWSKEREPTTAEER